ncbi:transmembrane protein, putative [Medicago truncatula]|uniref:Transmembrane protein, putative n=1 Tax=Medicago truncatula TaxID=3880 RepID=G8A192_MEDTR|nr:transmembrane protein, putative [Medicago truncatula]
MGTNRMKGTENTPGSDYHAVDLHHAAKQRANSSICDNVRKILSLMTKICMVFFVVFVCFDGVESPYLFVVPGPVQTFQNLFSRSNQRSVQLNRSSCTVLTKGREHRSHIVVLEFHPAEAKRFD